MIRNDIIKVLLVDDNNINRILIKKIIANENLDVEIIEAENGLNGFQAYKVYLPQLIFMDVQMPIMDGYESTMLIRSYENLQNITPLSKILAITAGELDNGDLKYKTSGMDGYITKPFTAKAIIDEVTKVLEDLQKKQLSALPAALNSEMIASHFQNDTSQIIYILETFEHYFFKDLDNLKTAFENNDLEKIKFLVHKIKPNFAIIGLPFYQEICSKIETTFSTLHNNPEKLFADESLQLLINNIEKIKLMIIVEKNRLLFL